MSNFAVKRKTPVRTRETLRAICYSCCKKPRVFLFVWYSATVTWWLNRYRALDSLSRDRRFTRAWHHYAVTFPGKLLTPLWLCLCHKTVARGTGSDARRQGRYPCAGLANSNGNLPHVVLWLWLWGMGELHLYRCHISRTTCLPPWVIWPVCRVPTAMETGSGPYAQLTSMRLETWFLPYFMRNKRLLSFSKGVCNHFLPRCMECRRGVAMRILSVSLSVKSVDCDKTEESKSRFLYPAKDHLA